MFLSALMLAAAGEEVTLPPPHGHLPHAHTHAPGETDETHGPVLLQATYTAEVIGNASGGLKRGTRYLDNFDIVFEADMEALVGWSGAQVHVYGLYNNGRSISDLVGDTQAVSNIETGTSALRLYEAWVDQKVGEHVSVRAGLYDLNSEFDALDAAGLFVSSPHGIGTDFAQSGQNGPSIFPSTSLAARLAVTPAEGWTVRAAVLDGVPGDPAHPARTTVKLGDGDGALLVGEVEAPLGGGKLLLGHWRYTADFDRNDGNGAGDGNAGTYVRAEAPLIDRSGRKVDAFVRLGTATGRYNMFDRFASGGLKFSGWVPGRELDEFGIAVAAAFTSDSWRTATGGGASEVAFEATYRAQLAPWLAVQPNIHYIHRPSADPAIADALVIGLRAEASFSLLGF
ncbi:carbohydrate porin [Sphingopyxis sp. MSC1_008]|jgi:porin|uniref:carbohydrate porin n=1 Tax=Sphingopyxis sp. MSC1_008 TaxID=2909265 RepID=UPI0020BD7FB2|nr:carbohydrate porin [Sphingopyxis sp. MSC1_008]